MTDSTLICTMGGQPQVVTFALDFLLAQDQAIGEVFAFHLTPEDGRTERALATLQREFEGNHYRGRPCRFRAVALKQGHKLLPAIRNEAEAEAVRGAVFTLVTELKQLGRTLHLCIAGGPRMMGLMALSAAMLYCGHQDKVWHMHTEPAFREQARDGVIMHDETGHHVRLVPVPIVPWGSYLYPLFQGMQNPADMMRAQAAWLDQDEQKRCQQVWDRLSLRQREVLQAYAEGLRPTEVAERLNITIKTVSTHSGPILAECRNTWTLPTDYYLDFNFIREKFRNFFR